MKKKEVEKISVKLIQILLILLILLTSLLGVYPSKVYAKDDDEEEYIKAKLKTSKATSSYLAYTGEKGDSAWQGVCFAGDYIVVCALKVNEGSAHENTGNIYVFDKNNKIKDCIPVPTYSNGNGHHCNSVAFDSKRNRIVIVANDNAPIIYDINLETGKLSERKNGNMGNYVITTKKGNNCNPNGIAYDADTDSFVLMYSYSSKYYLYKADEFYNGNKNKGKEYDSTKYGGDDWDCQGIAIKDSLLYQLVSVDFLFKRLNYIYVYDLNDSGKLVEKILDKESNLEMEAVTFDSNGNMCVAWNLHNGKDATDGDTYKKYAVYKAWVEENVSAGYDDVESPFVTSIDMLIDILERDDEISDYANIMKYIYFKYTGDEEYETTLDFSAYEPDDFNSSDADASDLQGSGNEEKIWYYLTYKLGIPKIPAAGLMGHMHYESGGFKTDATNPNGGAYGIAQWLDRKPGLIEYANKKNAKMSDLNIQLEYLATELGYSNKAKGCATYNVNTANYKVDGVIWNKQKWLNSKTPKEAAKACLIFHGLCGYKLQPYTNGGGDAHLRSKWALEKRENEATRIYNKYKNKKYTESDSLDSVGSKSNSKIVDEALKYVGNPYVWGGRSLTKGCDCSHFVWLVYQKAGLIPDGRKGDKYYCATQYFKTVLPKKWKCKNIGTDPNKAKAGDIILYTQTDHPDSHAAIYIGNGNIVEAQDSEHGITSNRNIKLRGRDISAIFRPTK